MPVNFFVALFSIYLLGALPVLVVMRLAKYKCTQTEFIPLAFLTGMGITAYQLMLYRLNEVRFTLENISLLPVIVAGLIALYLFLNRRVKNSFFPSGRIQGFSMFEICILAGIVVEVLWVLFQVMPLPVAAHDALANYALKAKIFYFAHGIPKDFFMWSETVVAHPDYPPLLPLVMTWIYSFIGFDDITINLIMPIIYVAFLMLFYSLVKRQFPRPYAFLITFFLATIPQLADYATFIHADLILTAFVTGAFLYFMMYVRSGQRGALVFSSVLFGISLWIKNEAVVFTGVFFFMMMIFMLRAPWGYKRARFIDILMSFAIVIAIALPWFSVKFLSAAPNNDLNLTKLTLERLIKNVKDIPIVLNIFQQQVFGPKKWNIFWVLILASLVWKRKLLFKNENFYAFLFMFLSGLCYFAAYMCITGEESLFFYVNTTMSRFLLHFTGMSLFLAATLVWYDEKSKHVVPVSNKNAKWVFFDRDGVINQDGWGWTAHGYITKWEDFHFLPGTLEVLKELKDAGYGCVVISNQQGVGKGYFKQEELDAVTLKMKEAVKKAGGEIAGVYYCVHSNEKKCDCRKPNVGSFHRAQEELGIPDVRGMFYIGDTERDMVAGRKMGLRTILVLSGKAKVDDVNGWVEKPDHICDNILDAVHLAMKGKQ